ncbi:MAG: hypothetical protein P4M13_00655 [Alphaproteobacteria bacterium]|nr:hypothetical protein [Alphaproteobacteria bacterium]
MNEGQINGVLSWLGDILLARRNHMTKLLLRLRDIGARAGNSLALHRKFLRLMEQVAFDREKEMDIIHEIESVEKRHREMRERKLLRQADVRLAPKASPCPDTRPDEEDDEDEPSRFSLWKIFGLLFLFSSRPTKPKDEEPKVS